MNRRQILVGGGVGLLAIGGGGTLLAARQMGSAADYDESARAMRKTLAANPAATEFVRYATLAANSHNTQAWQFAVAPDLITLGPDYSRRTPAVDPDDHHLFVSLGCAAQNLRLAAAARGFRGEPHFDEASSTIAFPYEAAPREASALFDAIPRRQSTRAEYDGRAVGPVDLATLAAAAAGPGVEMILITERPAMNRVRDLVLAGNSVQMADPSFMRELKSWLRFNPRQALTHGDGLYSAASGSPTLPTWLGPRGFDLFVTAQAENDKYARQLQSSSGIAVFVGDKADREHWVLTGQACQRFALQATALGLKHAFINQPVEVPQFRPELAALVGMAGKRPDIVMRFGHGPLLPYAPRRSVATVMAA